MITLDEKIAVFKLHYQDYLDYTIEIDHWLFVKSIELDKEARIYDIPYKIREEIEKRYDRRGNYYKWDWPELLSSPMLPVLSALEYDGFKIVTIFFQNRKLRITHKTPLTQVELFSKIHECVGDVANIKFTHGGIWIQLEKPKYIKPPKDQPHIFFIV